ncbi:pyridoxamine 5'-phosphate oxidase family protein [Glycomyces xiaoerkulensis]|uniref:pyridoxamine 5'-phosphate oxidase family protein n=1 Tax=Glycomyces xiaoerkulensis TaxID=2038139 RepID=UPI000C261552|nr:pyridoxamine 5'-phosphate oxidase family protein [Glycomyces xiaoerkulensis]
MRPVSHEGEQAVQRRAGEGGPGWGSPMFDADLSGGFAGFLGRQSMLVLAAAGPGGAVWTTTVAGWPGFARAEDERTLLIDALPAEGDPLRDHLRDGADLGILALEPQTRRRIRINGTVTRSGSGLAVRTEQVLGNCPKYLQTREIVRHLDGVGPGTAVRSDRLSAPQREWIETADTFFIGSRSPDHGADASHRGGEPGFVTVDGRTLRWPDYRGNSFYMTLGNVELDPAAGLLFLDWDRGGTLQMTGRCRVDWDRRSAAGLPGALRVVEFDVEQVVEIPSASPLRWRLLAHSRHNPPVGRP